jgi:DNA-directed RNA polymerase beta' subunit
MNDEVNVKKMASIIDDVILTYGLDIAPTVIDKIKSFGYKYATVSGTTWNIDAVKVPKEKGVLVDEGWAAAARVDSDYEEGLLSSEERYEKTIEVWQAVRSTREARISIRPHHLRCPRNYRSGYSDVWYEGYYREQLRT